MEDFASYMDKAVKATLAFATIGLERAMNQYNG